MTKIIEETQSKKGCKGKTVTMPLKEWLDTLHEVNEYVWEKAIDAVNDHVADEHGMNLSGDPDCDTRDNKIEIYLCKHVEDCNYPHGHDYISLGECDKEFIQEETEE